jgi:hypothetical protein
MLEIQTINNIVFLPITPSLKNLASLLAHEEGKKNST